MKTRHLVVAWSAVALALVGPGKATTLARLSLPQLAASSKLVVRARCLDRSSRWQQGEIWTFTRFAAVEFLKGSGPAVLTVRTLGGEVNGIVSVVDGIPVFRRGEEAILFLTSTAWGDYSPVGWSQGSFRIVRGADGVQRVTQDTAAVPVYDPARRGFVLAGVARMPLDQFRVLLRAVLRGSGQ
jgi:hypothetical protein